MPKHFERMPSLVIVLFNTDHGFRYFTTLASFVNALEKGYARVNNPTTWNPRPESYATIYLPEPFADNELDREKFQELFERYRNGSGNGKNHYQPRPVTPADAKAWREQAKREFKNALEGWV